MGFRFSLRRVPASLSDRCDPRAAISTFGCERSQNCPYFALFALENSAPNSRSSSTFPQQLFFPQFTIPSPLYTHRPGILFLALEAFRLLDPSFPYRHVKVNGAGHHLVHLSTHEKRWTPCSFPRSQHQDPSTPERLYAFLPTVPLPVPLCRHMEFIPLSLLMPILSTPTNASTSEAGFLYTQR